MSALYASHNQHLYTAGIRTLADIAELSRGGPRLETLSSTDNTFIFWFNTADHHHGRTQQPRVNLRATELLLATTQFTGRDVPLLRGDIVITGRDSHGDFADLTDIQIRQLVNNTTGWRDTLLLTRRLDRDLRRQRRHARKAHPANIFDSTRF